MTSERKQMLIVGAGFILVCAIAYPFIDFNWIVRKLAPKTDYVYVYSKELEKHPHNLEAMFMRGNQFCHLGQYQQAMADLDGVLQAEPDRKDALTVRCLALYKLKRYPEALADIDKVLAVDKQDRDYFLMRADVYEAMGKKDLANKDVAAADKLKDPPEWK